MWNCVVVLDARNLVVVVDEYDDGFQILLLEFCSIDPSFGQYNDLVAELKESRRRPIQTYNAAALLAAIADVRQDTAFDRLVMLTYWYSCIPLAQVVLHRL